MSWLRGLVAAAGLLWAADAALDLARVHEAAAWPTTPGRVLTAEVRDEVVRSYVGKWRNSSESRPRLHLAYEYTVRGERLTGTRLDAARRPDERDAAADRARYAPGQAVSVHYAPDAPSRAVLETTLPRERVVEVLLGASAAALALGWRPRGGARGATARARAG